jgi:hypothetical protein
VGGLVAHKQLPVLVAAVVLVVLEQVHHYQ